MPSVLCVSPRYSEAHGEPTSVDQLRERACKQLVMRYFPADNRKFNRFVGYHRG
jgi:hypothetical protein